MAKIPICPICTMAEELKSSSVVHDAYLLPSPCRVPVLSDEQMKPPSSTMWSPQWSILLAAFDFVSLFKTYRPLLAASTSGTAPAL